MKTSLLPTSLVDKFVTLRTKPIRNRAGAVWHRALVTAESTTGLTLAWRAWAFVNDKLVLRDYVESVHKSSITQLRTYLD